MRTKHNTFYGKWFHAYSKDEDLKICVKVLKLLYESNKNRHLTQMISYKEFYISEVFIKI